MKWKEFLKPDWRKLLILLLLVILISIVFKYTLAGGWETDTYYFSFPLTSIRFIEFGCPPTASDCIPRSYFTINYQNLILNLIFWYLISCLIIWIYDKVKKK